MSEETSDVIVARDESDKHGWTHPQCEQCWLGKNIFLQEGMAVTWREPVRAKPVMLEVCCWCGRFTISGIYLRAPSEELEFCGDNVDCVD